jgi:hypothetical protein
VCFKGMTPTRGPSAAVAYPYAQRWGFPCPATRSVMQFRIEITCETEISSKLIYCTIVDEISPARAKTKAAALLDLYGGRGANSAAVMNPRNEVIFRL